MVVFEREVLFQDVDAAGLVFFGQYATYAHEAMERLFEPVQGRYSGLITQRRIGLPAVRLEADYRAPLRYGDRVRIETCVSRLGHRSMVLSYRFVRGGDDVEVAALRHTVVCTDLDRLQSIDMPDDVRAVAVAHLDAKAGGAAEPT